MIIASEHFDSYLSHLLAGRRETCREIVQRLFDDGASIHDVYMRLFHRSMYEVGSLWETGRISVADEHLATAITESLMSLSYPAIFAADRSDRTAVISCTANEFHQIGGKMAADILALHGWDVDFLGANTSLDDLHAAIDEKKPDLVGLSLSVYFNMPSLLRTVSAIQGDFPNQRLVVGGRALEWSSPEDRKRLKRAEYVASLSELERLAGE